MSEPIFDPDDYRLTAYALGELTDETDRADVGRLLRDSPEARAALEETRAVCGTLVAEYDEERRQAETPAAEGTPAPGKVVALESHPAVAASRQRRHWLGLAAALMALGALAGLSLVELQREASRTAQNGPPVQFHAAIKPDGKSATSIAQESASQTAEAKKRSELLAMQTNLPPVARAVALPTPSATAPLPPLPGAVTDKDGARFADNGPAGFFRQTICWQTMRSQFRNSSSQEERRSPASSEGSRRRRPRRAAQRWQMPRSQPLPCPDDGRDGDRTGFRRRLGRRWRRWGQSFARGETTPAGKRKPSRRRREKL